VWVRSSPEHCDLAHIFRDRQCEFLRIDYDVSPTSRDTYPSCTGALLHVDVTNGEKNDLLLIIFVILPCTKSSDYCLSRSVEQQGLERQRLTDSCTRVVPFTHQPLFCEAKQPTWTVPACCEESVVNIAVRRSCLCTENICTSFPFSSSGRERCYFSRFGTSVCHGSAPPESACRLGFALFR
jgi:hypothetical protein